MTAGSWAASIIIIMIVRTGNESVATIAKAGVKVIVSSLTDMYIAGGPPWKQVYQVNTSPFPSNFLIETSRTFPPF